METRCSNILTYHEFDNLVFEKLGIEDYQCIRDEGFQNGVVYGFGMIGKDEKSEDHIGHYHNGKNAKTYVQEMVNLGILEPGIYAIEVKY